MNDEELDRALTGMPTPKPSANLQRSVAEIPLRYPRPQTSAAGWLPQRLAWAFWGAGALAVLLGTFSGIWASDNGLLDVEVTQVSSTSSEVEEFSQLAFADELDAELLP